MKRERKRERHDYSKADLEEYNQIRSREYYGIFVRNGRIHVDTKRFKKTLERMGAQEFWRDEMEANRTTPYLIPKKVHASDYSVNLCIGILNKLVRDWNAEFLPAIKAIKTPAEVGESAKMSAICFRSGEDAMEEASMIGYCASLDRTPTYEDVITTLYCSYVQRIASECDRAMALMFRKRGNVGDEFKFAELLGHINELACGDKKKRLENVECYEAFESIRKLDNFLKHHTVKSYQAVKKFCPDYLSKNKGRYQNGMYAPYWLNLPENFINGILRKLNTFFQSFCSTFFNETLKEAEWNNDDYFHHVYSKVCDPEIYDGIFDEWGNCLVG